MPSRISAGPSVSAASTRLRPRPPPCIPPDSKLLPKAHRSSPRISPRCHRRTDNKEASTPAVNSQLANMPPSPASHGMRRNSAARHVEEALHEYDISLFEPGHPGHVSPRAHEAWHGV